MLEIGREAYRGGGGALEMVSVRPRVWVADDFLSVDETNALMAAAPGPDSDRAQRWNAKLDATGFSFEWPIAGDGLLEAIRDRLTGLLGIENRLADTFRFRRYFPGDAHPPHLDCFHIGGHWLVFTALVHLEDAEEGGATVFRKAEGGGLSVAPRRGRLVAWCNYRPEGRPDPLSSHEGARLERGSKTTLAWFVYAPITAACHSPGGRRYLEAPEEPGRRLYCVNDGVPLETLEVMAEACLARGVQFVNVDVRRFDFSGRSPLVPGDMIYRPAVSMDAIRAEQHLFVDGAATMYREADGVFFDTGAARVLMERAGVPMPRGVHCHTTDRERLRQYAAYLGGFPLVAKFAGGSGGVNVVLVESLQGLYSLMDHSQYNGRTACLTAFVPEAEHWRLVVVGDEVVGAYLNEPREGDFRTYDGERRENYRMPSDPEMAASAVAAVQALRVELGGVDVLLHPSGRHYVLEANFPCYFATAQRVGGFDIAGAIVERLQKKAVVLCGGGL